MPHLKVTLYKVVIYLFLSFLTRIAIFDMEIVIMNILVILYPCANTCEHVNKCTSSLITIDHAITCFYRPKE